MWSSRRTGGCLYVMYWVGDGGLDSKRLIRNKLQCKKRKHDKQKKHNHRKKNTTAKNKKSQLQKVKHNRIKKNTDLDKC